MENGGIKRCAVQKSCSGPVSIKPGGDAAKRFLGQDAILWGCSRAKTGEYQGYAIGGNKWPGFEAAQLWQYKDCKYSCDGVGGQGCVPPKKALHTPKECCKRVKALSGMTPEEAEKHWPAIAKLPKLQSLATATCALQCGFF